MSSVYITEPPTRGKVLLHTTAGDIDVELWPKEAPRACRNFVQLALEGYYDGLIFHRIIKGLFVQTGDPTGTGRGGESVYGAPFADELHSRLKFSHRGIVASANENAPSTNGSQFFITLDKAGWLDKKHTIFGKVTGNTMFNVLRMGDAETDREDRPIDPPRLLSVEVLDNPFDDLAPRATTRGAAPPPAAVRRKAVAPAANLLSFGGDDDDEEEEGGGRNDGGAGREAATLAAKGGAAPVPPRRIMAAHDVAGGDGESALVSGVAEEDRELVSGVPNTTARVRAAAPAGAAAAVNSSGSRARAVPSASTAATAAAANGDDDDDEKVGGGARSRASTAAASASASEYDRLRAEVRAIRSRTAAPAIALAAATAAAAAAAQGDLLTPLQQMRAKYRAKQQSTGARESSTLDKLAAFTSSLRAAAPGASSATPAASAAAYSGQVLERDEEEEEEGGGRQAAWMSHKLKFQKHIDDKYRAAAGDADSLVTIDPLAPAADLRGGGDSYSGGGGGGGKKRGREEGHGASR